MNPNGHAAIVTGAGSGLGAETGVVGHVPDVGDVHDVVERLQ